MVTTVPSFTLDGIAARLIRIEADVHRGLPAFSVVGLPDAAVRESRERIRAALVNSGFEFPLRRIVVNLAPASLRKAGPSMDLAIAAALLAASGQIELGGPRTAFVGELALSGDIRPVSGSLSIAETAREEGIETLVVPAANAEEACLAGSGEVIALEQLGELTSLAALGSQPRPPGPSRETQNEGPDFADLRGQSGLHRSCEVAAAGAHNLLLVGPPGAGKSMAAARLPSILPPLSRPEALEVARIASAVGRFDRVAGGRPSGAPSLDQHGRPDRRRHPDPPWRGDAGPPRVLYLDDLCQFGRESLSALSGPLQTGSVALGVDGRRQSLPTRFILVASIDPRWMDGGDCSPVGLRPSCEMSTQFGECVDIVTSLRQPGAEEIAGAPGESSGEIRARVVAARERQERRLGAGRCNADMSSGELRRCRVTSTAGEVLAALRSPGRLSDQGYERTLRLAQTLADLAALELIGEDQVLEALLLSGGERR